MIYQTESKFQCWRAVAVSNDGEALLHLGRSSDQVQRGYPAAFAGLLDSDERASVRQIVLQCWAGVADQGRWATKAVLPIPAHKFPPRARLGSRFQCKPDQTDEELAEIDPGFAGAASTRRLRRRFPNDWS